MKHHSTDASASLRGTRRASLLSCGLAAAASLVLSAGACSSHHDGDGGGASPPGAGAPGTVVSPIPGGTAPGSSGAGTRGASPSSGRTGTISVGDETREQYCAGNGPPVQLIGVSGGSRGSSGSSCRAGLASEIFRFGLCACEDASFTGAFAIDALDSSLAAAPGNPLLASVGINDDLVSTGVLDIHGSLIAASSGLTPITTGTYNIDGNFATNSDLVTTGANITFGRDLWVNGDILAIGQANVEGDVHQTPPHTLSGMTVSGQVLKQDFTVPEPCACADDQLLDIDAIVAAGTAHSHNADVGLDDGTRVDVGVELPLDLECGRFAFDGAHFVGVNVLHVEGRTALFIDGDLTITGAFGIDLGQRGELDVFVTGNLLLTGAGDVGSVDRPAALRFYVGGSGDIAITGANRFAANLYAPRANVFVTGADDIYGAFFVGSYFVTGAQRMHYDAAVVRGDGDGNDCGDTPPDCDDDLDCGSPNVCQAGRCVPLTETVF